MCDHDLPFDLNPEPVVVPYSYKFATTSLQWVDGDIIAFEASDKYVDVVLRNEIRRPLWNSTLRKLIVDPRYSDDFIQTHRAVMVRTSSIARTRRIADTGRQELVTLCGLVFPVARRYVKAVRQALEAR